MSFKRQILKTEEEWLDTRKKYITATNVPHLFGLNPYASIIEVVRSKKGESTFKSNAYSLVGQFLEEAVIRTVNYLFKVDFMCPLLRLGVTNPDYKLIITSSEYRLGATPDAENEQAYLECKTTGPHNVLKWAYSPPLQYIIQLHTQLLCGDKEYGILAIQSTNFVQKTQELNLNNAIFIINRNKEIEDMIKEETKRFWKCFEEDKQYRVNQKYKSRMQFLLKTSCRKVK